MTRELSVIVPVLNEAATLDGVFRTLAGQREVDLELVVSDGGSTDGTADKARQLTAALPFPATVIEGAPGRGSQMNRGATASRGETLLFLHADSLFPEPLALRQGLDLLAARIAARGDAAVAGHFPLRFRRSDPAPLLGYYYYECKARLHRPDCTLGDQGFLLRRQFFDRVGPFDESFPILEDVRLAVKVRLAGEWLLLPAEVLTSARRFEAEGLRERQTMNAILMNFAAMGWEPFLRELPRLYRTQEGAKRLDLALLFLRTRELMAALPRRERQRLWQATGAYVRGHAWQVPFYFDVQRNFDRGLPPGAGPTPCLDFHDRYLARLITNGPGRLAATCLTWLWFRLACHRASRARKVTGAPPGVTTD